jgi:hypothetical protein
MTERDDLKETAKTTMTDAGIERSLSNLLGIQMPKSLAQTIGHPNLNCASL